MQTVFWGDSLLEPSKAIDCQEKNQKKIICLLSAEVDQRDVSSSDELYIYISYILQHV